VRALLKSPADLPDAFVISLDRLPSHGRTIAGHLRARRSTGEIPIVFAGGDPEKAARALALTPGALASAWNRIGDVLPQALSRPLAPAPWPTVASQSPMGTKLGLKAQMRVLLIQPPEEFGEILSTYCEGLTIVENQLRAPADAIFWFVRSQNAFDRNLEWFASRLLDGPSCRGWIAWPKQSGPTPSDLTLPSIRRSALEFGLVDYKIVSLDKVWASSVFGRKR
jgi:hypothetical protein